VVSILPLSTIFLLDFEIVPTVWYFRTVPTVWYFRIVPTVWYFRTVPTVWYFGIVPTVWYFRIVPTVWYFRQTTQWPKDKVQKDKHRPTKHTYKTKDRVTRTPLKPGINSGAPEG
jgi:hypothetical protein